MALHGSLVEQAHGAGVLVFGAEATIEATAVRSTQPDAQGTALSGLQIQDDPGTKVRANVKMSGCMVEENYDTGVSVIGSDATIEATVVRSTQLDAKASSGNGIAVENSPATGLRGNLTVVACLIEQNHQIGVAVNGSDAAIEATVVRSTLSSATGIGGRGIEIDDDKDTKARAQATIHACVLEQNREVGVFVLGSDVTIEATVVRSTLPDEKGDAGHGIEVGPDGEERTTVTIRACLVEQSTQLGVFISGSDATIETTTVRSTLPNESAKPEAQGGRGITLQDDTHTKERSTATVRACLVEKTREGGVFVSSSDVTIEDSVVRDTDAAGDDTFGDGISVDHGTATVQNVVVTHNVRAGIAAFGGQVQVTRGEITCNGFDLDGEITADGIPFSFDGSAGWQCSRKAPAACTELGDCSVSTSNLQAPREIEPAGPAGSPP